MVRSGVAAVRQSVRRHWHHSGALPEERATVREIRSMLLVIVEPPPGIICYAREQHLNLHTAAVAIQRAAVWLYEGAARRHSGPSGWQRSRRRTGTRTMRAVYYEQFKQAPRIETL